MQKRSLIGGVVTVALAMGLMAGCAGGEAEQTEPTGGAVEAPAEPAAAGGEEAAPAAEEKAEEHKDEAHGADDGHGH